jgi:hypothetical protein
MIRQVEVFIVALGRHSFFKASAEKSTKKQNPAPAFSIQCLAIDFSRAMVPSPKSLKNT